MTRRNLPTRTLRERPDLDQLRRQAKELLAAFAAGEPAAVAEVSAHYRDPDAATFALHDAQLALARSYGFDSWPKLKAYVDGVTVARLADAVRAGDAAQVRALLAVRPELVHMDTAPTDEHRALHYAVLGRAPGMVRLLMEHGADARKGIYPHRDATSALAIATDRGYGEIVAIIEEEERRRREAPGGSRAPRTSAADALCEAVARGDAARTLALLPVGAAPANGLLTLAVEHERPEMLALLLDLGLDPDERTRVEGLEPPEHSWGMPLWHCAEAGRLAMAELLLERGADPNGRVYASGSPVHTAYRQRDAAMIALLRRYGGAVDAITAGMFGHVALAAEMLAGAVDARLAEGLFAGPTVAEQLLWGAADGGHPEIVRMALAVVAWTRDDGRWYRMLWRPLPGHAARSVPERESALACLRLLLERADADARGPFGRTLLHDLAARGTPEEQVAFATVLLDAGARVDVRDDLLRSTPLGWACRWGRRELVHLLLERGADPVETGAEHWATPRAWAEKRGHAAVLGALRQQGR